MLCFLPFKEHINFNKTHIKHAYFSRTETHQKLIQHDHIGFSPGMQRSSIYANQSM